MEKAHSLPIGFVIDNKYRIDGLLSEAGGMGEVYKATQSAIGRKVAVKIIRPEFSKNSQLIERFKQEARIAGSIGHGNICEVTDLGELPNGSSYLVMPLLLGSSLADLLKKTGVLSLMRVMDIACQTLSALSAAHARGIVHRDLKPDNIFVTTVGDRSDFVKLLDFGISKILHQDKVQGLTQTGTTLGTPQYMSPEQARGSKDINALTDIYSMGVILYHAITGERPFDGSYNEIIAKILVDPYPTPRSLVPNIPTKFENVILKAMARTPSERFQSAEEMSIALRSSTDVTFSTLSVPLIRTMDATAVESDARFGERSETSSEQVIAPPQTTPPHSGPTRTTIRSPEPKAKLTDTENSQAAFQTTDTTARPSDVPDYIIAERRRKIVLGGIAAILVAFGLVGLIFLRKPPAPPVAVPIISLSTVPVEATAASVEPAVSKGQFAPSAASSTVHSPASTEPNPVSPSKAVAPPKVSASSAMHKTAEDGIAEKKPKLPKTPKPLEEKLINIAEAAARAKRYFDIEKAKENSESAPPPASPKKGRYGAEAPDEF